MDLYCPWEPAKFLFFSENIPSLLYYSHFTGVVISLLLGTFVILSSKKDVRAVLLFIFFLLFSAWAIIDVAIWATNQLDVVMFWWSMVTLIEPLLYVTGSYLVYAFIYNKFPPFRFNLFWFIFFALLLVLTPTY